MNTKQLQILLSKQKKQRFHLSRKKINKLVKPNQFIRSLNHKPDGLWYAFGNKWIDFSLKTWPDVDVCCFIYELKFDEITTIHKPNKNKILRISGLKDLELFINKYGFSINMGTSLKYYYGIDNKCWDNCFDNVPLGITGIHWYDVSNDFAGVEIVNFEKIKNKIIEYFILMKNNGEMKYMNDRYSWFFTFSLDSGCIWDIKLIKKHLSGIIFQKKKDKWIKT